MPNLTDLANKYFSDKGTVYASKHKYTYLYDLIFNQYRDKAINLLEMGLAVGGPEVEGGKIDREVVSPSVLMWSEYFPKANIYGFDISDFSHMKLPRFTFTRGDSGSEDDIRRLADVAPSFDIIIDDASHASYHQQMALKFLYSRTAFDGLYIIEDLHWQSPFFEDSLPKLPKTADFLLKLFEEDTYIENSLNTEAQARKIQSMTASFSAFGPIDASHKTTKIIVLRRKSNV